MPAPMTNPFGKGGIAPNDAAAAPDTSSAGGIAGAGPDKLEYGGLAAAAKADPEGMRKLKEEAMGQRARDLAPGIVDETVHYIGEEAKGQLWDPAVKLWKDVTSTPLEEQHAHDAEVNSILKKKGINPKNASLFDQIGANMERQGFMISLVPGATPEGRDIPRILYDAWGVVWSPITGPIHAGGIRPAAEALSRMLPVYKYQGLGKPPVQLSQQESEKVWENNINVALTALGSKRETAPTIRQDRLPSAPERPGMTTKEAETARAKRGAAFRLINIPAREEGKAYLPGRGAGELKSREVLERARRWRETHAGEPTLADVAPEATIEVGREMGGRFSKAKALLQKHLADVRERTSRGGRSRARMEAPNPSQSSGARRETIRMARNNEAATKYRAPWAIRIRTDNALFKIIYDGWPEGHSVVKDALNDASRRKLVDPEAEKQVRDLKNLDQYLTDYAQYEADLKKWKKDVEAARKKAKSDEDFDFEGEDLLKKKPKVPPRPEISAGALDRIYGSARNRAKAAFKAGDDTAGGGIHARAQQIDEYLQNVPGLSEARAAYREKSLQMEQLEFDENLSTMSPIAFREYLSGMSKKQKAELTNRVMDTLANKFGTSEGHVKFEGANMPDNLRLLLGDERASQFMEAIRAHDEALDAARRLAGGPLSIGDERELDLLGTTSKLGLSLAMNRKHHVLWHASQFLERWVGRVTPEQAEIIARWLTQNDKPVEDTLREIVDATMTDEAGREIPIKAKGELDRSHLPAVILAIIASAKTHPSPETKVDNDQSWRTEEKGSPAVPPPVPTGGSPAPGSPQAPALTNPFGKGGVMATPASESEDVPAGMDDMLDKVAALEGSGDDAVSPAGAIGKYQIWPPTAERYGLDVDRLFDPDYNRYAASVILGEMYNRFNGDWGATLAEYNGGRGAEWLRSGRNPAVLKYETRKYLYRAGIISAEEVGQPEPGEGRERMASGGMGEGEGELRVPDFGMPEGGDLRVPDFGGIAAQ